jgi:hypothetical protein
MSTFDCKEWIWNEALGHMMVTTRRPSQFIELEHLKGGKIRLPWHMAERLDVEATPTYQATCTGDTFYLVRRDDGPYMRLETGRSACLAGDDAGSVFDFPSDEPIVIDEATE